MSVFGGPYRLFNKKSQGSVNYDSVISLCIMDDFKLSERVYMNGNQISQIASQKKDLADVIEGAILRLEHLMQKEMYHPKDPMDI